MAGDVILIGLFGRSLRALTIPRLLLNVNFNTAELLLYFMRFNAKGEVEVEKVTVSRGVVTKLPEDHLLNNS